MAKVPPQFQKHVFGTSKAKPMAGSNMPVTQTMAKSEAARGAMQKNTNQKLKTRATISSPTGKAK